MKKVPVTWKSIVIMQEHGWLKTIDCTLSKKGKREFMKALKRLDRDLSGLK